MRHSTFRKNVLLVLMIGISSVLLFSEEQTYSPEMLIGAGPADLWELLGPPDEVYSARGDEPWQDDVVFFYGNYRLYLFWFNNRVWQIRLDTHSPLDISGVRPGTSRDVVQTILGSPDAADDDWVVYVLQTLPYPLHLRLFFAEGKVEDLYLFRGDF